MRRLNAICLLLMLLVGCMRPLRPTPDAGEISLAALLTHYQSKRDALRGFDSLLYLSADTDTHGRHTVAARWQSGERTEIEGFSLFGNTLFNLTRTESHLILTTPNTGRVISVARDEIEKIDALPVSKIELRGAMALMDWVDAAAIPNLSPSGSFSLRRQGDMLKMHSDPPLIETLWIDPIHFHLLRVERFHPDGTPESVFIFEDYRKIGEIDFPFLVNAEAGGDTVTLKFREVHPLDQGGHRP